MRIFYILLLLPLITFSFYGCAGAKEGSATVLSKPHLDVMESRDVLAFSSLQTQEAPLWAARESASKGLSLATLTGGVVSMAYNGVKQMIDKNKSKYSAAYPMSKTDMFFYDQVSSLGPFDPTGMKFGGFQVFRTFKNESGQTDTAFAATFVLDTSRIAEIVNNSIFRLKLRDFRLYYAAAKVAKSGKKLLNMDFEITFTSSYVNEAGSLFDNATIGKFFFTVRDAPLDPAYPGYKAYYDSLPAKTTITGHSFIVPRSFGYRRDHMVLRKSWGQGAYAIQVGVKESSKNNFVNKILTDNSYLIMDFTKDNAIKMLNNKVVPKGWQ